MKNFLYKRVEAVKAPTTLPAILSHALICTTLKMAGFPVVAEAEVNIPDVITIG